MGRGWRKLAQPCAALTVCVAATAALWTGPDTTFAAPAHAHAAQCGRSHRGRGHHGRRADRGLHAHCAVRAFRAHRGSRAGESSHAGESSASGQGTDLATLADVTCPNTSLMPEAGNIEAIRGATFCLINRERARNGVNPLRGSTKLQAAAQFHANDMVKNAYFEHVSPSGETLLDRVRASGYVDSSKVGYVIGENIAYGTLGLATPQEIVASWMASPGHRANILDPSYHKTGIGVVAELPESFAEGQAGAMYTQTFGTLVVG
jgi:uncharacterized protein YkwD